MSRNLEVVRGQVLEQSFDAECLVAEGRSAEGDRERAVAEALVHVDRRRLARGRRRVTSRGCARGVAAAVGLGRVVRPVVECEPHGPADEEDRGDASRDCRCLPASPGPGRGLGRGRRTGWRDVAALRIRVDFEDAAVVGAQVQHRCAPLDGSGQRDSATAFRASVRAVSTGSPVRSRCRTSGSSSIAARSVISYCIAITAGVPLRTSTAAVLEKMSSLSARAPSHEFRTVRRSESWSPRSRPRSDAPRL